MFVELKKGLYVNPDHVVAVEGSSTTKDACNVIMSNGHRYYVYAKPADVRKLLEGPIRDYYPDKLVDPGSAGDVLPST